MVESSGEATDGKLRGLSSGTGKVYRQYSGKVTRSHYVLPSQDFLLEILLPIALLHGSQFESRLLLTIFRKSSSCSVSLCLALGSWRLVTLCGLFSRSLSRHPYFTDVK